MNWIEIDESVRTAGRIIVGSGDHLVHIYDLETREELQTLKGHDNFIHGSVFSINLLRISSKKKPLK